MLHSVSRRDLVTKILQRICCCSDKSFQVCLILQLLDCLDKQWLSNYSDSVWDWSHQARQ
jgi:hypothetical protein